jgi:hypothetical protein
LVLLAGRQGRQGRQMLQQQQEPQREQVQPPPLVQPQRMAQQCQGLQLNMQLCWLLKRAA